MSLRGNLILDPIVKNMDENLISFRKGKVKVLFSQLKESDVVILGATWEL